MEILGIDIGGSGIKGALVDTERGFLLTDRLRIDTPQPSTPDAVVEVVCALVEHYDWRGPVGCAFPAIVKAGKTLSAANVDDGWVGHAAEEHLRRQTGCPLLLSNDADAAGIAEMAFGAGKGHRGLVFIITLGTGIGSAIFYDGVLIPNSEVGHLELQGREAEKWTCQRGSQAQKSEVEGVGLAGKHLPGPPRVHLLARPLHPRRWRSANASTSSVTA